MENLYVTDGTGHQICQVELRFLQHVLVFTVKRRHVPFIYTAEYTLEIETFLCKNKFSLPVRNCLVLQ